MGCPACFRSRTGTEEEEGGTRRQIPKMKWIKQYVPQSSSLDERFTSRASAGESRKTYYHPGRSVFPLDAHVLKEDCPSHWAKSP